MSRWSFLVVFYGSAFGLYALYTLISERPVEGWMLLAGVIVMAIVLELLLWPLVRKR
ncbi:MAG: hypothetical protein OXD40_13015 [bacterium]|nr:hypothetical protein [bacterium]